MLREIVCPQRKARLIPVVLNGSSGTPALGEGQFQCSVADGGVGIYTLSFNEPFHRAPVVVATPVTADAIVRIAATAIGSVELRCFDATDGTTAKDIDLHVMVLGFDAADEY